MLRYLMPIRYISMLVAIDQIFINIDVLLICVGIPKPY